MTMFHYKHSLPQQHPITPLGHLRRQAFGLSNIGGSTHTGPVRHQEVIDHLMSGFNSVLESSSFDHLQARVAKIDPSMKTFTYEGVAMALTILDHLRPDSHLSPLRFAEYIEKDHIEGIYIGVGLALARLQWPIGRHLREADPDFRRWITDGYGFGQALFHSKQTLSRHQLPSHLPPSQRQDFDIGVGRALWFKFQAQIQPISDTIITFPTDRQSPVWEGVGFAATYGGGGADNTLNDLIHRAGAYQLDLQRGVRHAMVVQALENSHTTV